MNMHESVRKFCATIGENPLLVQGAGGNVSWKEDATLWIKASGTWLAEAITNEIFVQVELKNLTQELLNKNYSITPQMIEPGSLKPSIETLLHALMPHPVVVHLHAVEVLAHLVRETFELSDYPDFDTTLNARVVNYFKPGADLAKGVADQLENSNQTRVIFLKSHGIILGGESIEEIDNLLSYVTKFFRTQPVHFGPMEVPLPISLVCGATFNPVSDVRLHELSLNPELITRIKESWALYPDHVVFMGAQAHIFESREDAQRQLSACEELPDVIFIKGAGTFTSEKISKAKSAQLTCYYDVIKRQPADTVLSTLRESEIAELLNWDAEKLRIQLSK